MELRTESGINEVAQMSTNELRKNFLFDCGESQDHINLCYSYYDRMIFGTVAPKNTSIDLPNPDELKSEYFLERRELAIVNIGKIGQVEVDGAKYELGNKECLYVGKGSKVIRFSKGGYFFLYSAQAYKTYPTKKIAQVDAEPVEWGTDDTCNRRKILKYIHPNGADSCQVVVGITELQDGNIWNTMPAHTHGRRSEVYFYFNVEDDQAVCHFMGHPQETRHLWVHNKQAVISPHWSIHSGAGTKKYSFIWCMAGENRDYSDMDWEEIKALR